MKYSARNTLDGTIVSVKEGPVSTEVILKTECGQEIASSITTASAKRLDLKVGKKAQALIKASSVIIATE
jgi:molybdopterin-binding protein